MQLFTLEISKEDARHHPRLVVDVLEKIWSDEIDGHSTLAPDMEFAVRDSEILVPRFRPVTFAAELTRLSEAAATNADRPIRAHLEIKKRGLLTTLHWQQ